VGTKLVNKERVEKTVKKPGNRLSNLFLSLFTCSQPQKFGNSKYNFVIADRLTYVEVAE